MSCFLKVGFRSVAGLPALALAVFLLSWQAAATEKIAAETGETCRTCHVSDQGGTLLSAGRAYRIAHLRRDGKPYRRGARRRARPDNEISGTATVMAGRHEEPFADGSESTFRAFADLNFMVDRLGGRDGLSFHGDLIGRLDDAGREVESADQLRVVTGYLRWEDAETGRVTKVGRQFVTIGPRPLYVDGADIYQPISELFDVEVVAGLPSENGEGGARSDLAAGGRFGWRPRDNLDLGASTLSVTDDGEKSYQLAGLDARWEATEKLRLYARGGYDLLGEQLYDALVRGNLDLSKSWFVRVDASRVTPGATIPKTSIFSVFSDETIDQLAIDITHAPDLALRTHVFVRGFFYESGGDVRAVGGGLDYAFGEHREGTAGGELSYSDERRGAAGTNVDGDLLTVRLFVRDDLTAALFGALDLTADLFGGGGYRTDSYSTRAYLGWRVSRTGTLTLGVERLDTVQYGKRYDTTLKYLQAF